MDTGPRLWTSSRRRCPRGQAARPRWSWWSTCVPRARPISRFDLSKGLAMRLWTVQPLAVWERLEANCRGIADPFRANPDGWAHPRYSWLAWQLRARITGSRGHLPWWAYCAPPDLRWVRHSRPAGSREVRIE